MKTVWDGVAFSRQIDKGKGVGKKTRKPVNFIVNVLITEVDEINGKFKGIGVTGTITAQDFMYQELEYEIPEAGIQTQEGGLITIEELRGKKNVHVQGKNMLDGTFTIEKIVTRE